MKTILMQGDSITDAGRNRTMEALPGNNHALGNGYANLTAAALLAKYPEKDLQIYNRGISGNRVVDLYARWKVDTLNLQPDILSILIGVNDVWHERSHANGVEADRFEQIYDLLLEWTFKALPQVNVVLLEPFTMLCGEVDETFAADTAVRAAITRKLAAKYNTEFLPTQQILDEACKRAEPAYWAKDGVHPTPAGHALITEALLKKFELFL